jgi:hypothetical protein
MFFPSMERLGVVDPRVEESHNLERSTPDRRAAARAEGRPSLAPARPLPATMAESKSSRRSCVADAVPARGSGE